MFPMAGDQRPVYDWADCSRGLKVAPKRGMVVVFYSILPGNTSAVSLPRDTDISNFRSQRQLRLLQCNLASPMRQIA